MPCKGLILLVITRAALGDVHVTRQQSLVPERLSSEDLLAELPAAAAAAAAPEAANGRQIIRLKLNLPV